MGNVKITINLDGPQGNSFYLLGIANSLCIDKNLFPGELNVVISDLTKSDYNHLLTKFHKYFKNYVKLTSNNKELKALINGFEP